MRVGLRGGAAFAVAAVLSVAATVVAIPNAQGADYPQVPNYCNAWTTNAESITVSSSYRRFVFTESGTFTTPPNVAMPVRMMIAGGGGGGGAGGSSRAGGGGGGGAVLEFVDTSTSLEAGTTYTITVGAGGAGSTTVTARGANGEESSVVGGSQSFVAAGGGGGGSGDAAEPTGANGTLGAGASVGSSAGGGGAYDASTHAGGSGAAGAGNGGAGQAGSSGANESRRNGGGGGGASPGNGGSGTNSKGGNGGSGESNSDSGSSITFGGGGGGGGRSSAGTASGGGGAGGVGSADGTDANLTGGTAGGGGGGGGNSSSAGVTTSGGDGARGEVIIAHRTNYACSANAPSSAPEITGTVAGETATLTWASAGTLPAGQSFASWTVLYYPAGSTTAGAVYARGGTLTPRSLNVSGANISDCAERNAGWTCVLSKGVLQGDVTFKVFMRTSVGTVTQLSDASPTLTFP